MKPSTSVPITDTTRAPARCGGPYPWRPSRRWTPPPWRPSPSSWPRGTSSSSRSPSTTARCTKVRRKRLFTTAAVNGRTLSFSPGRASAFTTTQFALAAVRPADRRLGHGPFLRGFMDAKGLVDDGDGGGFLRAFAADRRCRCASHRVLFGFNEARIVG